MCVLPVTSSYQIQSTGYSRAGVVNILYPCVKWHMKWICLAYKHILCAAAFQMITKIIAGQKKNHIPLATVVSHWAVIIFRHICKIAERNSQLHNVSPSVRMEQLGSHWMDFHEIWYLSIFKKIC